MSELDYDLEPVEERFTFRGTKYVIREASAGACKAYKNATLRAAKLVDGKIVCIDGAADAELVVLQKSIYRIDAQDGERPIDMLVVSNWPNKYTSKLFKWLDEHSELRPQETVESIDLQIELLQKQRVEILAKGEEEAKNEQSGGPPSSGSA